VPSATWAEQQKENTNLDISVSFQASKSSPNNKIVRTRPVIESQFLYLFAKLHDQNDEMSLILNVHNYYKLCGFNAHFALRI